MKNYFENLHKRIIWVAIGILCYYFAIIPVSLIPRLLLPGNSLSYFSDFSLYSLVSIGLLLYFVYRALFRVSPSLMPPVSKHKKIILVFFVVVSMLSVALPSGLILPEWAQGQCSISSAMIMQDGTFQGSTTSQTMSGISECHDHCKYQDELNPKLEKTCEFRGMFDSAPIGITNESAEYNHEITFDGKRK